MFSAYSIRNAAIGGVVAATSFQSYSYRPGYRFGPVHTIHNWPVVVNRREADRSYGLMYLMIALGSVLFVLLMVPSIIEPPVLYIGVIFSLLSIIFIIGFMNSYLKHKSGDTFVERSGETLGGHLSSDSHHITEAVTVDANDGLTYNGSQVSTASSDLPPKYELPPSYEQSIYSINI